MYREKGRAQGGRGQGNIEAHVMLTREHGTGLLGDGLGSNDSERGEEQNTPLATLQEIID